MVGITLQYYPLPYLNFTRTLQGKFPSSYHELNEKQLMVIAGIVKSNIPEAVFLQTMTGISIRKIRRLDEFHRFKLLQLLTVFTEIKPHPGFIIGRIACLNTVLYAPKPKLQGVTFGQFIFAESYFSNYQTDNKPDDLCKFVASLYLPEGAQFSESLLERNFFMLKEANMEIPEAVSINYLLVREWLCLAYPLIFLKEEEDAEAPKPKHTSRDGWIKIFESLVGDDIVNHERYALLPVHNVFRYMTAKIKESMKRKK